MIIDSWEYVRNLPKRFPEQTIVIDAGMCTGCWQKELFKVRPEALVFGFEPEPRNYVFASQALLPFCGSIKYNCGLSDKVETLELWRNKDWHANPGWCTVLQPWVNKTEMEPCTAHFIPLDTINIGRVDLVKIDVEGYEFKVLRGMMRTLRDSGLPTILVEIGGGKDKHPHWQEELAVFEELFAMGYDRFDISQIDKTCDVKLEAAR